MFYMLNAQVQLTSEMWYAGRGDEGRGVATR